MNDRLRRLLITFGPVIGALLLFYLVNMAVDTYSVGVEELRTERRAEATAEAQRALTETVVLTDSVAETTTNPIDAVEAITSILPNTVTETINLDAAITETAPTTSTESVTGTEAITDAEAVTGTEAVTATNEVTSTEATTTTDAATE